MTCAPIVHLQDPGASPFVQWNIISELSDFSLTRDDAAGKIFPIGRDG
jgi:hypothetical protein